MVSREIQGEIRDDKGRFIPGVSGNPNGRPKGETLKEFSRKWLMSLSNEEKMAFLEKLPPEIVYRMAEGNPHSTTDTTIEVSQPIPLLGGLTQRAIEQADTTPARTTTQEASDVKEGYSLE